jgi:hypothetical protein
VATNVGVDAHAIARQFAAAIRHEPAAKRLWVAPHRDYVELWLLTSPIALEMERPFFEVWRELTGEHAGANIRLHVLNPSLYADGVALEAYVPPAAEPVSLRD